MQQKPHFIWNWDDRAWLFKKIWSFTSQFSSTTYYLSLFKRNGYFFVVIPMIRIPTGLCTFNSPESSKSGKKFNKMSNGIRAMKPRFKFYTNLYNGGSPSPIFDPLELTHSPFLYKIVCLSSPGIIIFHHLSESHTPIYGSNFLAISLCVPFLGGDYVLVRRRNDKKLTPKK